MSRRALIVATLLSGLTGCRATFDIPHAQAPCVEGGKVRDVRGQERTVRQKHDVILYPAAGAVFMHAPNSDVARAVPAYDEPPLAARGLQLAKPEGRSLEVLPEGVLRLRGPKGTWSVPAASVGRIEINQFSPWKTAGLVTGSFLGGAILTAGAVIGIWLLVDPPSFDFDFGSGSGGGWAARPPGAR